MRQNKRLPTPQAKSEDAMPFTLRFLLILACLALIAYGAVWYLASFPPEQTQIVKPVSSEALRQ